MGWVGWAMEGGGRDAVALAAGREGWEEGSAEADGGWEVEGWVAAMVGAWEEGVEAAAGEGSAGSGAAWPALHLLG